MQDQISKPITIGEAADYLGTTTRSIRNYIARGHLPAARIKGSNMIRIRRADVERLLVDIPTVKPRS